MEVGTLVIVWINWFPKLVNEFEQLVFEKPDVFIYFEGFT